MNTISQPSPTTRTQPISAPAEPPFESQVSPQSELRPARRGPVGPPTLIAVRASRPSHHPQHGLLPPQVERPAGEPSEARTARISGKTFEGKVVTYSVVDGQAYVEGDIAIGEVNQKGDLSKGVVYTGRLWPKGLIPYEVVEPKVERKVRAAIRHLESNTPLRFVERTPQNSRQHPNYLSFFNGSGCWSYMGMRGGKQKVSIAPGCGVGSTVHEIMHASGVWHEQSREDRDEYVTIQWDNIGRKHKHNFRQHIRDGEDVGDYDYRSLMHYPRTAFSTNGKATIVPKDRNAPIGQRRALSRGDIATLRKLYGQQ